MHTNGPRRPFPPTKVGGTGRVTSRVGPDQHSASLREDPRLPPLTACGGLSPPTSRGRGARAECTGIPPTSGLSELPRRVDSRHCWRLGLIFDNCAMGANGFQARLYTPRPEYIPFVGHCASPKSLIPRQAARPFVAEFAWKDFPEFCGAQASSGVPSAFNHHHDARGAEKPRPARQDLSLIGQGP